MTVQRSFVAAVLVALSVAGCDSENVADPTTVNLGRCSCTCRADTSGALSAWGATFAESPESKACLEVCGSYENRLDGKTCRPSFNSKYEPPREAVAPDADFDGVPDSKDQCPNESGLAVNGGCPAFRTMGPIVNKDADGDGIEDEQDKCPKEPETKNGYHDEDGCPDEIPSAVAKFSGSIEGVVFKTGSADLAASSNGTLTKAAEVFKKYNDVRVEISGHTDNVGNPNDNTTLSQKRAESVKNWFVKHGISDSRLEARGYGPQKPIAPNDTDAGRAKNRRVEFHVIQ